MVDVDEFQIVKLLQDEMTRVIENIAALVSAEPLEKHFKRHAVVKVFAGMNFEAQIYARLVERIENRLPTLCQFVESRLHKSWGTLRPGIKIRPGQCS